MTVVHASSGDQPLDRKSITSGHTDVSIPVYRTTHPPIFAGFQTNWVDGNDSDTGATFSISAGAGLGSPYATLRVEVPGRAPIYEYIDITELLTKRVMAILEEVQQVDANNGADIERIFGTGDTNASTVAKET